MSPITLLRRVGIAEGISFLLLLGIAMPLKYVWGKPQAVMVVGWAHGALFIAYFVALLRAAIVARLPLGAVALLALASLVPVGPFIADGWLRRRESPGDRGPE